MAIKHDDGGIATTKKQAEKIKPPPMYQVVLLNDDYTPMDFVIMVIEEYFNKDRATAMEIMLRVHNYGRGICGVYPKDIASTKVELVMAHAKSAGHPLQCVMEEA